MSGDASSGSSAAAAAASVTPVDYVNLDGLQRVERKIKQVHRRDGQLVHPGRIEHPLQQYTDAVEALLRAHPPASTLQLLSLAHSGAVTVKLPALLQKFGVNHVKELDLSDVWVESRRADDKSSFGLLQQYQLSLESLYMVDLFEHPDGPFDSGLDCLFNYVTAQNTTLQFPQLQHLAISLEERPTKEQVKMLFAKGGSFSQLRTVYMHVHPRRTHSEAVGTAILSDFKLFTGADADVDVWPCSKWNQMAASCDLAQRNIKVYLNCPLLEMQVDEQLHPSVFGLGGEWKTIPVGAHPSRQVSAPAGVGQAPPPADGGVAHMDLSAFSLAVASRPQRLACPATVYYGAPTSTFATGKHTPETLWPLADVWQALGNAKGRGVRVAILDSGFAPHHFYTRNVVGASSVVPFHYVSHDPSGHGTHIAGILARVAPEVELKLIQVFSGAEAGKPEWLVDGLRAAVDDDKVDIISLSGGTSFDDPNLYAVTHEALAAGKIVVCAASNHGSKEAFGIAYPAAYGGVLCVGSHDQHGSRSGFSPTGRELDLLAPGEFILSAAPGQSQVFMSGTSMACPFVAGLVALLLSSDRQLAEPRLKNISQVRRMLRELTTKRGDHTQDSGHGPINLGLLVKFGREQLYKSM